MCIRDSYTSDDANANVTWMFFAITVMHYNEKSAFICFMGPQKLKSVDIHHQICTVYGKNIMNYSAVKQWGYNFWMDRIMGTDEERSGRLSVGY